MDMMDIMEDGGSSARKIMERTEKKDGRPYTTGEIASLSHVTINAVKKWIHAGKLNAFRTPGGHYRVLRSEFREFIEKYRMQIKEEVFPERKKVLITDDEPAIIEFLRGALAVKKGKDFYEIETAGDGYEALIKVGSFNPDLLILDIRMPRINGLEVCRRLRSDETTRGIKILAITAFGNEEIQKVIEAGADYCLPKPLNLAEVTRWVEKLLKD
ncbi:MAG: response regulator [Deltaproteobacteria bacterium]|nr:response regulator [Deltaproteobacteria bacterium]